MEMEWSSFIRGLVLIIGVAGLALWANGARYRDATRFREQYERRLSDNASPDCDN